MISTGESGGGPVPHTIRLRGPWVSEGGARVKLPTTWGNALGDADSVVLSRSFNRPTNLDQVCKVLLRVESQQRIERILVNGSEQVDGSELLGGFAPSNRLSVTLSVADPDAPVLDAWLELYGW